jgi:hypothetical protein
MYTEKQKQLIIKKLKFVSERQLYEAYDDVLDDVHGCVMIVGCEYCTSDVLKSIDPTAYKCGFSDWLDSDIRDGIYTDEIKGEYYLQSEVDELLESTEEENEEE